jgi:hypothetical protein
MSCTPLIDPSSLLASIKPFCLEYVVIAIQFIPINKKNAVSVCDTYQVEKCCKRCQYLWLRLYASS